MIDTQPLVERIDAHSEQSGASLSTLSRKLFGNGKRLDAIKAGGSLTITTYNRALVLLDDMERITALENRTHDSTSAVDDEMPAWALTPEEIDVLDVPDEDTALRVVICSECDEPLSETQVRACQAMDCPHAQQAAA